MGSYDTKIIGKNIKEYRIAKNLTRKELSKQADISITYLATIENGIPTKNGSCGINIIYRIAEVLGVSLDDIAGSNIECRQYENVKPIVNRIMLETESISYSKLLLFKNIMNTLTK